MIVRVIKKVEDIKFPVSLMNSSRNYWNSRRRYR